MNEQGGMMRYTGGDPAQAMGDPAGGARDERRGVARRIDCDSQPRQQASYPPARGGAPRDSAAWERPWRGYGR